MGGTGSRSPPSLLGNRKGPEASSSMETTMSSKRQGRPRQKTESFFSFLRKSEYFDDALFKEIESIGMSPTDTIKIKEDYSGKYVISVHFRHVHQLMWLACRKGYMADEKYAIHKFDLAEFLTVSFMMIGPNNDSWAAVARRTSGNIAMPFRWKPCSLESGPLSTRYSTVTHPDKAQLRPSLFQSSLFAG